MLRFQLDTTGNLLKDLIAWWPLDEPGGQRRDMLGYNPLTDNDTINIQVDNGRFDSTSFSAGVFNSTGQLVIGAQTYEGTVIEYWDGRIQYVGFWKRVLSQQERTDLYNFGRGNRLISY